MRPLFGLAVILPILWGTVAWTAPTRSTGENDPLTVDLSEHEVAITTGFAGARVLLFGAVEGDGDIVVTLSGPVRPEVVWRSQRVFGIWANVASATIDGAPAFYRVASTRPLDSVASPAELKRLRVGLDNQALVVKRRDTSETDADYIAALIRLKEKLGLYQAETEPVTIVGRHLFRAGIVFPANVPTGSYLVSVYLMRDGKAQSVQTTLLAVRKTGMSAEIFDFADRRAALYGVVAVAIAAIAGWLAAQAFRRT